MSTPDPRRPARPSCVLAVALGVLTLAACAPADDGDPEASNCAGAVAEAAEAAEVADTVRLLDTALVVCRSFSSLSAQIDRHPGMIGYDAATFVELRCTKVDDEAIRTSPSCANVVSPASTVPVTTTPEIVFVGDTLDGRQIEIRPGPTVEFVGGVPAVVQQTVDIALEAGCDGVIAQRDEWVARIDDPETGDIASVYAQHAQNVAVYIGCAVEPVLTSTTVDGTEG